jgi:hypothetical protein
MTRIHHHACARRARAVLAASAVLLTSSSAFAEDMPPYVSPPTLRHDARPRLPYREGMPVPEGYHLEETPRYGLIAAGASMTATLWIVSTISAIALDRQASINGDPNFDDRYWPMFIPVAGPFATIATADSSGTGAAILALDGTIQAVGLAMAIAGFAAPTVEIVPDYQLTVTPLASGETGGLAISGSF